MSQSPGSWTKRGVLVWWYTKGNKVVGFVRQSFNCWDAYIITGKRWPEGQKSVRVHTAPQENPFYAARRAVEEELGYFRGGK